MVDIRALRGVNLNRLPVLWELLRCRNVSTAAENLGLTQSTVSTALRHLRELFEDELLVPAGRELVLTERAQELLPLLETSLTLLQDLVSEPVFDPGRDETQFRISTADYVSVLLLPDLVAELAGTAPHVTVQVLPPSKRDVADLKLGLVDLIIGPENMLGWLEANDYARDFDFEACFSDSFVGIARAGTPPPVTAEAYLRTAHVAIQLQRAFSASLEHDHLSLNRMEQFNRILVPDFSLLPLLVSQSDLVSLIPRSLAETYVRAFDIQTFEPPIRFPPLELGLFWRRGRERDPRFGWFLDRIRATFARRRSAGGHAAPLPPAVAI